METGKSIGGVQELEQSAQACWLTRVGVLALVVQFFVWEELIRHHFPEQSIGHPGRVAADPLGFFLSLDPANPRWTWGAMLVACALTWKFGWGGRRSAWVLALNVGLLLLAVVMVHQMTGFVSDVE